MTLRHRLMLISMISQHRLTKLSSE